MRRRIVAGFREVAKHAGRGKLKGIFVAPDIDRISAQGLHCYATSYVGIELFSILV